MQSSEIDLSIVIITLNEEANIDRCLRSLPLGAEIVVVDSFSTDHTCDIAASLGAHVSQHPFQSYGRQKNYACSLATRRWIFSIDADEELDAPLREWLVNFCSQRGSSHGEVFRFRRRLIFMEKIMRFGKCTDYPIRLFLRGNSRFVGDIHEKVATQTAEVKKCIHGTIFHHSYADLSDYFKRFNHYTTEIAKNHHASGKTCFMPAHLLRPWFEFFYRYVVLCGFLDGYPGYTYALLSSLYTYVKYSKLLELYTHEK